MAKLPKNHPLMVELRQKIEEAKKKAAENKHADAFMWIEIKRKINERFSRHANHVEEIIKKLKKNG